MQIRRLSKSQEKRLLAGMLAGLTEQPDNGLIARFRREAAFLVFCVITIAVILGVLRSQSVLNLLTVTGAFAVGLGSGVGAWQLTGARHWPAVARCLDRDKIEARLRELDA
jgi:hypothetical protein